MKKWNNSKCICLMHVMYYLCCHHSELIFYGIIHYDKNSIMTTSSVYEQYICKWYAMFQTKWQSTSSETNWYIWGMVYNWYTSELSVCVWYLSEKKPNVVYNAVNTDFSVWLVCESHRKVIFCKLRYIGWYMRYLVYICCTKSRIKMYSNLFFAVYLLFTLNKNWVISPIHYWF